MLDYDDIRKYWDDRAVGDSSVQSTTQDVYLREIEARVLEERIERYAPRTVVDIGCGDGRTTARLAEKFPQIRFNGFDYSSAMIANTQSRSEGQLTNIEYSQADICDGLNRTFELAYTTRCLINVPPWEMQQRALRNIHAALAEGGMYLMVENFIEGQENFNAVRRSFGLPEIAIREHNLFFVRDKLMAYLDVLFDVEEELNISSSYYLASRVLYSRLCADSGKTPDYFDDHHRYGAALPFTGEFGPVRLLCLRKKQVSL